MLEAFKPIPVHAPSDNRILFNVRCVFDLQMLTLYRFLVKKLSICKGRILDVGVGKSPWRELIPPGCDYVAVDVQSADSFGMGQLLDMTYYDGQNLPYDEAAFDYILCTEVLEHVADPESFMREIHRVL